LIHRKKYSSALGAGRQSGPAAVTPNRFFVTRLLRGLGLGSRMNVGLTDHASSHRHLNMKKTIRFAVAVALGISLAASAADWHAPQDPFAVYGNTYYVGTGGISAVLIASPAGHVLIDGGPTGSSAQIAEHVRKLGFKVEDIRYILNGHEHFDHAGGIAELQKMSGAVVLASPASAEVLRTGLPDKRDAQYPSLQAMTPVANTRAVRDGEVVRLGPLAVTAHFTPGIRWGQPAGPGSRAKAAGQ
jgi:beta-lactamase superfamily II metal-dependent hydrolase